MDTNVIIVVVDDDPLVRSMFAEMLRTKGYTVHEASTGNEGLRLARLHRPDLVLLDLKLPDIHGFEVCKQIKQDPALADVFVVLVSGKETDDTPESWGMSVGADDYISKPVAGHEFLARVRFTLRLRETTAALRSALELNQAIMETSPIGILAYRADGQCIFANPAAARIIGINAPVLLHQSLREQGSWHPPDFLRVAAETFSSKMTHGGELQATHQDGKKIWLEYRMELFSRAGAPHLLAVINDITERKRMEQELHGLPKQIIAAQERERLRVARDLHDGVNQILASAKMRLRKIAEDRTNHLKPSAREILVRCDRLLVNALDENRRIAHNLRPSELDELGLAAACKSLCDQFALRANITVTQGITPSKLRFSADLELSVFRILQEALNNIEKHAMAQRTWVRLGFEHGTIALSVIDDGRGFDSRETKVPGKRTPGLGLTNIRERAAAVGGSCEIVSTPGRGTSLTVLVPFAKRSRRGKSKSKLVLKHVRLQPSKKHNAAKRSKSSG